MDQQNTTSQPAPGEAPVGFVIEASATVGQGTAPEPPPSHQE